MDITSEDLYKKDRKYRDKFTHLRKKNLNTEKLNT